MRVPWPAPPAEPRQRRREEDSVDFWDLTKLFLRRWYLALPVLLATAAATLVTVKSVNPNYIVDIHVQMIPPVATGTDGQNDIAQRNPWLNLGPVALASASIVAVQDASVLDQLKA